MHQLTEEQRAAIIKEAVHRGMTHKQAHDLVYGADDDSSEDTPEPSSPTTPPHKDKMEKGQDDSVVLASGPMYRPVAPVEQHGTEKAAKERKGNSHSESVAGNEGQAFYQRCAEQGGRGIFGHLGDALPDPAKDVVENLVGFQLWMVDVADEGTEPTWDVDQDPTSGTATVVAQSQVSDHMTVRAEIVSPATPVAKSDDSTVMVTVTDPTTGDVLAASEPQSVETPKEASHVAISEVADAVIEARSADDEPQPTAT
ncbi:hypothetical protein [Streptomyces sp. NPDC057496]|uniref:hypothetical protein n=1 Tax=Streptomyces sp. NPDC057496 TaxID=3346149 RepID=UPI0036C88A62